MQLASAVQSWPDVISKPNSLIVLDFVDQAVPVLAVYDDGLRCQVAPDQCHYVCRRVLDMRKHCRQVHGWVNRNVESRPSKNDQSREQTEPWVSCQCQRIMVQGPGSQYFVVLDRVSAARQQTENVALVWQQAEQAMTDAWEMAEKLTMSIITEGESGEVSP